MTTTETRTAPSSGAGRAAFIAAAAVGLGLFAFIGVRVKETLANRDTLTKELEAQKAKAGKREAIPLVVPEAVAFKATIPVTGVLAPVQDADVGFKAGGRLQSVRVKVGDRVKGGQALASLDVSEAAAQASAARAGVRAAEVSVDMADDAQKRTEALFAERAVSDAENLAVKNRAALAKAQLEQARAQAALAGTMVQNGSLVAPFAGLVTRAPNGIGKIVGPGEALFHLEDTSVLKLSATLSEADARAIQVGDEIVLSEQNKAGKITAVLGSLDAQTRRVPMVAEIPNDDGSLLAGSFVRAVVTAGREVRALRLPATALRPGSQDELVIASEGKARFVRVTFTTDKDGSLLVRSGLEGTPKVVASPSADLHEGEPLDQAH